MSNNFLTRRSVFGAATAAMAAQVGASLLGSRTLANGRLGQGLLAAIARADGTAFGQAACSPKGPPIVHFIRSAKSDPSCYIARTGEASAGIAANTDFISGGQLLTSAAFPEFGLTQWFGNALAPAAANMSLALFGAGKAADAQGGNGNHDFAGTIAEQSKTGSFTYNINKQMAALLACDFSTNSTVDTSTAVFAEGGAPLITYNSISSAVSSITSAAAPLAALPTNASALQLQLNKLVSSDPKFAAQLAQIGDLLKGIVAPLHAVGTASAVTPTGTSKLTPTDYMNLPLVAMNNPLLFQLQVAQTLWDAGLTQAVTCVIGNSDTNTNGDAVAKVGGQNTSQGSTNGQFAPVMAATMLGQAIAQFMTKNPTGWGMWCGEGGRSQDQSDRDFGLFGMFGPAGAFTNTFVGGSLYATAAGYGSGMMVANDDGTQGYQSIATIGATLTHLAGVCQFGDYKTVAKLLGKS